MRIAVMGTGAVGGYFGAKLAAARNELVFIARGEYLAVLRRDGLRIQSANGNLHIKDALFTSDPAEFGQADLVLFCVKSYDSEVAAAALAPLIGADTSIVSLQNGVDNPEKIARLWGARRTFAGVVYIGAQIAGPGVIVHSAGGKIVFGQSGGDNSAAAKLIERTLSAAGINCAISEQIETVQWTKLLWNAPFCAISSLAHADTKQILESDTLTKLAVECMTEVQAAARTRGIDLPRNLFDETIAFSAGLGHFKPSMLQDLEAGKPLEYEAFNGIVAKLLQQAGKAAPVNQCFYALLEQLDKSSRQEAHRQPRY
jgi:2-dehydropantoate 2-reductase